MYTAAQPTTLRYITVLPSDVGVTGVAPRTSSYPSWVPTGKSVNEFRIVRGLEEGMPVWTLRSPRLTVPPAPGPTDTSDIATAVATST